MDSPFLLVERGVGGVATISMRREPVNTMDLALWEALTAALAALEADPSVRAVVFRSGLARDVFTAGNDLGELYAPGTTEARYRAFWLASNRFLVRLYVSRLATVAAIRGACPAGGCCLALCCDARVMAAGRGHIGLNETALGIAVPLFWARLFQTAAGVGAGERLLQTAALLPPEAARAAGLVHAVVPAAELDAAAAAAARELLKVPDAGRAETKRLLRSEFAAAWEAYLEGEAARAWAQLAEPRTVAALRGVMERLAGRKAKL